MVNLPVPNSITVTGSIYVRAVTTDWVRAAAFSCGGMTPAVEGDACTTTAALPACDPYADDSDATQALPRLPRCENGRVTYKDIVLRQTNETLLPEDFDGTLSTDCGPRFIDGTADSTRRLIQVYTDTLGVFQAYQD